MKQFVLPVVLSFLLACGQSEREEVSDSTANDSTSVDSIPRDSLVRELQQQMFFADTSVFPSDYVVMDSVYGNLNLDPYTDVVMVFCHKSETEGATYSERPRALMIFLGDSSGMLNLEVRNDNIVYAEVYGQMFGESFDGVEIDSGMLRVNHYGGSRFRWTADYVFEYNREKKSWYYTRSYASMGDMLGEMNDLDSTGQCVPYATDTLIIKKPIDIRKFDNRTADVASTSE